MVRNGAIADLLTRGDQAVPVSGGGLTQRNSAIANRPALSLVGQVAIVVDDGRWGPPRGGGGRHWEASRVMAARSGRRGVALQLADEVVCPLAPPDFGAVSRYYQRFTQVDDDEVVALLSRGSADRPVPRNLRPASAEIQPGLSRVISVNIFCWAQQFALEPAPGYSVEE